MGDRESSSFQIKFKRPKQRNGTVYKAECPWIIGSSNAGEDNESSKSHAVNAMIMGNPSEAAYMNISDTAEFPFQHVEDLTNLAGPSARTGQHIIG